jgi:hypothetical protein
MPLRQQVIVATAETAELAALSAALEAESFDVIRRGNARAAADAVTTQPFDLAVVDASFVLNGGVRPMGLARFRETPAIVIGDAAAARACAALGTQIMFLERPIDPVAFICTATMALMESRPERRSRRWTVHPLEATVNGMQSLIIEVSREGVRLEIPRDRRAATPQFTMRVPLVGVGVSVQRRWVRMPTPGEDSEVMWCGGQLHRNSELNEQAWCRFIGTLIDAGPRASLTQRF